MKVAINTLAFDRGGAITHINNILPHFTQKEDEFIIIVPEDRNQIDRVDTANFSYKEVRFPVNSLLVRFLYEQLILPLLLFYNGTDVLYVPTGVSTLFSPCPTVTTIRNIKPYLSRTDRSRKERVKYRIQRSLDRLSAKRARRVIFVSEYTKNHTQPYLGIDDDSCVIIYHGINHKNFQNPAPPADVELEKKIDRLSPYVVYVSTLYRHKNHEALIQGYADLSKELRKQYSLVLAGGSPDNEYLEELRSLVESNGIKDDVVFLGRVDYSVVPYLFARGAVSVMPSKLETFGIPLIEAMAAGTPVIAADAAALPEITGDAGLLFEPDDTAELRRLLEQVLTDQEVAERLSAAGSTRADGFSWERTAEETYAVIRGVDSGN